MLQRRRTFLLSPAIAACACSRPDPAARRVRIALAGTPAALAYLPHLVAQELDLYRKVLAVSLAKVRNAKFDITATYTNDYLQNERVSSIR